MNVPVISAVAHLPTLIDRAASALIAARSSAEVLEARDLAGFAYDAAKRAGRLARAKTAHDEVIAAAFRAQADALEIEAQAKRRLADEYDAAQERGEVRTQDAGRPTSVPGENTSATVSELGLTRKAIHEARQIRDAEAADPGIVKRALDARVDRREEPTRVAMRQAVVEAAARGLRPERKPPAPQARNPVYQPDPAFDAVAGVAGSCRRILEFVERFPAETLLRGCTDAAMRARTVTTLSQCRDVLSIILERSDA